MRASAVLALAILPADALLPGLHVNKLHTSRLHLQISLPDFLSPSTQSRSAAENENKSALMELLAAVPPNEPTPKYLTSNILNAVDILENECPTPQADVIPQLASNWELIWTAQDASSTPNNIFSWIK